MAGLTGPAVTIIVITRATCQLASVPLKTRQEEGKKNPHHTKGNPND